MITYCTVCRERVLVPAGKESTRYCAAHEPRAKRRSTASIPVRPARRPASSRGTLFAIGGVVAAVTVVAVAALARRAPEPEVAWTPLPARPKAVVAPPTPAPLPVADKPVEDPHADARRALEAAKRVAAEKADDPEAVVKYCREHYSEVERSPFEAEFKAILDAAQQKLDVLRASTRIDEALAAAEKIRAEDTEFRRRDEFERKLDDATRLADRFVKARLADVAAARERWRAAWAAAAEAIVRGLVTEARKLADEKRWDDALRKLDDLPEQFASAPAAAELERVREEIRQKRGAADAEAAAKLKRYVGSYEGQEYPVTVDIDLADGGLRAKVSAPMQGTFPMTPAGEHKFRIGGAITAEFVMNGEKVEKLVVEMGGQSVTLVPK